MKKNLEKLLYLFYTLALMRWLYLSLVLASLNVESQRGGCPDSFNSEKSNRLRGLHKEESATLKDSSRETSVQETSDTELSIYKKDIPSHFFSINKDFVIDSLEDIDKYISTKRGGPEDKKYMEFDSMLDFVSEETPFSYKVSQALAKKTLKKERLDEYYYFDEYPIKRFAPDHFLLRMLLFFSPRRKNEQIRKSILERYKEFTELVLSTAQHRRDNYLWLAEKINLYGTVLWRLGKKQDAERLLQISHKYKGVVGSYYLALNTIEDHMYNNRSIHQAINYLEDSIEFLLESTSKGIPKNRPYYQDKLMKLLVLSPFVYKRGLMSLRKRKNYLLEKYRNEGMDQESLNTQLKEMGKTIKEYKKNLYTYLLLYLTFTKYSQAEQIAGMKYGVTTGGFVDLDKKSKLIQIIKKYNKNRDQDERMAYRSTF